MSNAANAYSAYRRTEVETVSQRDLIVMLYQGAERFLGQSMIAMQNRRIEDAHNGCMRARAIFEELLSTLNMEAGGEIAVRLKSLYAFFLFRIGEANLLKDASKLAEIMPIIATLREGWQSVPNENANVTSLSGGAALNMLG